jgi:hypothetical protein
LFLAAYARWPVVHYYCYLLSEQAAHHAHLVAGAERNGVEAVVCHIMYAEIAGVVDQTHVDAAGVGRIMMDDAQVQVA